MIEPILGPLVPYEQAEPKTRADFLKGLLRLWGSMATPGPGGAPSASRRPQGMTF